MTKRYFVGFLNFNKKHQRSNILEHTSIVLLEGIKDEASGVSNLNLISSYGFYSHKLPPDAPLTIIELLLKKMIGLNFRVFGSYAEFKKESLTGIDLGMGISCGPLIEVAENEKKNLVEKFEQILENEKQFFSKADKMAEEIIHEKNITDEKIKKYLLLQIQTDLREKYYKEELTLIDEKIKKDNFKPDMLIEETALSSGLITEHRFQQEKLKEKEGINFFEFSLDPQGSTCRTLAFEVVMQCLAQDLNPARLMFLSKNLHQSFYTQAIPRCMPGLSKAIFDSVQHEYASTSDNPPFPERQWNKEVVTQLMALEKNAYVDIEGNEQAIKNIDRKKEYFIIFENLSFLKRLLNDFASGSLKEPYQKYIKTIDQAIKLINDYAENFNDVLTVYHQVLKDLKKSGCFEHVCTGILKTTEDGIESISNFDRHLKTHKIKIEDGVRVEMSRLKMLKSQAEKVFLAISDLINRSSYFSFFFPPEREVTKAQSNEIEMNTIVKFES